MSAFASRRTRPRAVHNPIAIQASSRIFDFVRVWESSVARYRNRRAFSGQAKTYHQSTGFDERQFGQYREIGGNWRSTLRTEIAVNPLTTIAGVMKGLKSPLD